MSEPLTEAPADGVEGGVVEPEEAPGVAETGTEGVTPEEPAASPWAPSQEDWQALTSTVQTLAQQTAPSAPAAPQAPGIESYMQDDGTGELAFTPDGLGRYIADQVQNGIRGALGSYEPILNQVVTEQGNAAVNARFDSLEPQIGRFDRGLATLVAEGLVSRGSGAFDSVDQAAKQVQAAIARERQAAVNEYKQTLGQIGQAPREPAGVGSATTGFDIPRDGNGRGDYAAVANAWADRNSLPG
jgi:hypothetical protein